jgi:hypothetical protein
MLLEQGGTTRGEASKEAGSDSRGGIRFEEPSLESFQAAVVRHGHIWVRAEQDMNDSLTFLIAARAAVVIPFLP